MVTLRDYQTKGVDDIRASYKNKNSAPLYVLPTGGGKTIIFCHIAQQTSSRNKRVLVLVHRIELLRQTSKALTDSTVKHGLINPKYTPDLISMTQVASVQTLIRRLSKIKEPDLIIVDEAHHTNAGSWKKVLDYFPKARILGVTATPIRGDGRGLGVESGGVFDDLILGPQIPELIELGYLVAPIVYAPPQRLDLSDVKISKGDYDSKEVAKVVDKPKITGDAVDHYEKLCPGVPAVAFCVNIEHAKNVAAEFRGRGYRAYHVEGSMDDDQRSRILDGLGNGMVDVVTSCDLISEGTDIPAIGCALLLRPTQSPGLFIQQVGRALRPAPGKDCAVILDHVGNVLKHGLPDQEREWELDGKKRKIKRGDDGIDVNVRQCEKCYAVYEPAEKCPYCGHTNERKDPIPEQVDGELTRLTDVEIKQIKRMNRTEVSNAKTLKDLEKIGKSRGYKPGWAKHVHESRNNKLI